MLTRTSEHHHHPAGQSSGNSGVWVTQRAAPKVTRKMPGTRRGEISPRAPPRAKTVRWVGAAMGLSARTGKAPTGEGYVFQPVINHAEKRQVSLRSCEPGSDVPSTGDEVGIRDFGGSRSGARRIRGGQRSARSAWALPRGARPRLPFAPLPTDRPPSARACRSSLFLLPLAPPT